MLCICRVPCRWQPPSPCQPPPLAAAALPVSSAASSLASIWQSSLLTFFWYPLLSAVVGDTADRIHTHACTHTHTHTYGYTHAKADTLTRTLVNDNYCTLLSRVCLSLTKLSTRITLSYVTHTLTNWKLSFPHFSSIQLPSSGKFPGMPWWG